MDNLISVERCEECHKIICLEDDHEWVIFKETGLCIYCHERHAQQQLEERRHPDEV